jgi:hypothetical protein
VSICDTEYKDLYLQFIYAFKKLHAVKMQINKTLIRPVVTYGSETWTLTKPDENLSSIFERKIQRRIYGPVLDGNIWRNINNEELDRSING